MSSLDSLRLVDLQAIARENGMVGYSKLRKAELLKRLQELTPSFEDLEEKGPGMYVRIGQLGKEGKEGIVYLVADMNNIDLRYAMKTFRKTKSPNTLRKEAYMQYLAAADGIAPKVHAYNLDEKYIVMEPLDHTLMEILENQEGKLTLDQQMQIIELYNKLDGVGVMLNDANPLNIMEKKGRFYMIDFGFAKYTSHKDFKKYLRPNYELMPVSLLLMMRNHYPTKGWTYIREQISKESARKMGIDQWP